MLKDRIKLIMDANGWNMAEFARKLRVTPPYVSGLLKGKRSNLGDPIAALIEHETGFCAHWVLTGEGPMMANASENEDPLSPEFQTVKQNWSKLPKTQAREIAEMIRIMASANQKKTGLMMTAIASSGLQAHA